MRHVIGEDGRRLSHLIFKDQTWQDALPLGWWWIQKIYFAADI